MAFAQWNGPWLRRGETLRRLSADFNHGEQHASDAPDDFCRGWKPAYQHAILLRANTRPRCTADFAGQCIANPSPRSRPRAETDHGNPAELPGANEEPGKSAAAVHPAAEGGGRGDEGDSTARVERRAILSSDHGGTDQSAGAPGNSGGGESGPEVRHHQRRRTPANTTDGSAQTLTRESVRPCRICCALVAVLISAWCALSALLSRAPKRATLQWQASGCRKG